MHKIELELDGYQRDTLVQILKIDIGASLNLLHGETDTENIDRLEKRLAFTVRLLLKLY